MKTGERTNNLIYEYCLLRYRQELDLKQFKSECKDTLKVITSQFSAKFISKQNIDYHRASYDKLINTRFSEENTESTKDYCEMAESIYDMLILFKSQKNSNCVDYYLNKYIESKELIIKYYIAYFECMRDLKEFKENQFQELRLVTNELIEDLTPVYIAKNVYKRLKADLHILKFDSSELDFVRNTYDALKEKLLLSVDAVNKDYLKEYK